MRTRIPALLVAVFTSSLGIAATLELTAPLDFQVVQRGSGNSGVLPISGGLIKGDGSPVSLEARLIVNGKEGDWEKLAATFANDGFAASLPAPAGGWYRFEIRACQQGEVVADASVGHVGVGEIFVIAGQSNSANHGSEKQSPQSGLVVNFDGKQWQPANDPQPGASGGGGSFIPAFGDGIAENFHVPVGIVSCGSGGTSVRHWLPKGGRSPVVPTNANPSAAGDWESDGALFDNLVARTARLGPHGFRAVLWHQGESDANQQDPGRTLPGKLYRDFLETIITASRRQIGWEAPWFVARASYHGPGDEGSAEIRDAQASLWQDGVALEGADSDQLKSEFRENDGKGVHFSGPGLREHAARWVAKISPWLGSQTRE